MPREVTLGGCNVAPVPGFSAPWPYPAGVDNSHVPTPLWSGGGLAAGLPGLVLSHGPAGLEPSSPTLTHSNLLHQGQRPTQASRAPMVPRPGGRLWSGQAFSQGPSLPSSPLSTSSGRIRTGCVAQAARLTAGVSWEATATRRRSPHAPRPSPWRGALLPLPRAAHGAGTSQNQRRGVQGLSASPSQSHTCADVVGAQQTGHPAPGPRHTDLRCPSLCLWQH